MRASWLESTATEYFAERFFTVLAVTSDSCVGENVNVGVGEAIVDEMMIGLVTNIESLEMIVIEEVIKNSITFISRPWWY